MKTTCKNFAHFTFIAVLMSATAINASDANRLSRYTLYPYTAELQEKDLLSTIVETTFPRQIATIGSAIDYILLRSGYQHLPTEAVSDTLQLTLPLVHRSIGPIDTRGAVQTLIGNSWDIVEDEKSRTIWFQLAGSPPLERPKVTKQTKESGFSPSADGQSQIQSGQVSQNWNLDAAKSLRQNLAQWVRDANWALEWNSHHDYEILHSAEYRGTLQEAVAAVLEHYRHAPFTLTATFFQGNSVLLVESTLVSGH